MAETERFSSSTLRYANFGLANRATPKACALGASPFASSAQISLMRFFINVKKLNHSIVLPLPQKANLLFEDPFLCSSSNILNHEQKKHCIKQCSFYWRRQRDLNSRTGIPIYSLSRGAPSAKLGYVSKVNGGENRIRTYGTFRYHWFSRPAP